jgi:hypothetical protein
VPAGAFSPVFKWRLSIPFRSWHSRVGSGDGNGTRSFALSIVPSRLWHNSVLDECSRLNSVGRQRGDFPARGRLIFF